MAESQGKSDKGDSKESRQERDERMERLKHILHDRGEDVAKLVRTWLSERDSGKK
ncbi:MAG: hypothetical protein ABIL09_09810 [Gemmatimonadota bacterium]